MDRYGAPPDGLGPDDALANMLAKTNLYGQEAQSLVSTDLSKIKILKRHLQVIPAEKLLPDEVACYIRHHQDLIAKSPAELEADRDHTDPITPYWDPGLRDSFWNRMELYWALDSSNLLTFRRRRRGRVAFFAVSKKDGMQRLIVDARDSNSRQKKPPTTRLSTPTTFMDLDFSNFNSGLGEVMETRLPSMTAGDVGDCFYNFSVEPLASWFCTDDRMSAGELRRLGFKIDLLWDDDLGRRVAVHKDEMLWFTFAGVCMGWSWALYFANEIVVHQCHLAAALPPQSFLEG